MSKNGSLSYLYLLLAMLLLPALPLRAQDSPDLSIDLNRLSPDTARFALLQQDTRIGEQVVTLSRAGSTWTMIERTETPVGFQATTVTFADGPEMHSVRQHGRMGETEIATDIAYADGRVTGRAIVPSAAGLDTVEVDAAVPQSTIDDNALVALFPAMELAPEMSFTLPVFAAGKNELHDYAMEVRSGAPVQWRGESVATLRIDATVGTNPVTFVVTRARPHLLLQILPPGPLRIERIDGGEE